MSGGPWVAAVLLGAAAVLIVWALTAAPGAERRRILENLRREIDVEPGRSRGVSSGDGGTLLRLARALTPAGGIRTLERLLAGAGRPKAWPLERVLVTKLLLASGAAVLGLWLVGTQFEARRVLLGIVLVAVGWFLPDILLYNTAIKRRAAIQKALPDVLDQLSISVAAGLGFEASLAHVGRNSSGPLADELIRTLQDIQVGAPRSVAYAGLADRAQVDDLSRFVRAIRQAEQYGVSIASVLDAQAREMRVKRRQRAEESALQIPVKVIFPLILFILPTLFVVVLGPAIYSAFESFPRGALP